MKCENPNSNMFMIQSFIQTSCCCYCNSEGGGDAISPPFAKSLAKYNKKRRHIFQWVVALELSLQKCHKTYVLKYNYRTYMFFFTHSINQKYVDIFRNWR